MIKTYSKKKDGNKKITSNFIVKEFACGDGTDKILIDTETVNWIQAIRNLTKAAINITSGYRTTTYNKQVGGVTGSYHTKGMACDTYSSKYSPLMLARAYELVGARGIGYYSIQRFVHVDSRPSAYKWQQANIATTKLTFLTEAMIKDVQELLTYCYKRTKNKNYNPGDVDGILGPKTRKAFLYFCNNNRTQKKKMCTILSK